MSRVILAMSGGVDSSVAAWLLRSAGHDVTGVFMRHGQSSSADAGLSGSACGSQAMASKPVCCSASDAADARRVAERLEMPFHVLDLAESFERIIDHFVDQYAAGRTPNPCILCNTWLKFGKLFEYADAAGAQFVATGHYARLARREVAHLDVAAGPPASTGTQPGQDARGALVKNIPALLCGVDRSKDQSYALFGIERRRLDRVLFPVGEHHKEEIRQIAAELDLDVAAKCDSQEICFVPDQDHAGFVRRRRPGLDTAGEVVTTDGTIVGRHDGFERFTVGQRRGLGIAMGQPYYVARIEPDTRRVVLGRREELARRELTAGGANWLVDPPQEPFRAAVKIRYRSRAVEATVEPLAEGRFHVAFDEPRHGVAPGQAAVCYAGDQVLGGGWIE
ncbi:MAG: tRNA-specific 2-thiouridylase [Pirellulales bacterium]|nr:tRNA-specific 2-thiouridylase [Pirellulales bacterium]